MTTVTWLHLSDLHFKSGEGFEEFNQKIVLEALWDDIESQIEEHNLDLDFIVFSGDIAYHGKQEEYTLAAEHFFDPLQSITGVPKGRLFIVPGNHDVNWDLIDEFYAEGMRSRFTNRDKVNQFLSKDHDRRVAFQKFRPYADFIKSYFEGEIIFDCENYYYTQVFEIGDYQIAVLGLNSTWASPWGDPYDEIQDQTNLLIGEMQIHHALQEVEQADLRIALFHHPPDWLQERDRTSTEKYLQAQCDFILHGHLHVSAAHSTQSLSGAAVRIPSGSIYAHRDYPNGYNFTKLDLGYSRVKIHFRKYDDQGHQGPEWTEDTSSTGNRDGMVEFELPEEFGEVEEISESIAPLAKWQVLLVENEKNWQKTISEVLLPPRYELRVVDTYGAATQMLNQSFDLVILNLNLQGENDNLGVALLDDLNDDEVPCIVLTGSSRRMRGLFERYGVCEIFSKGPDFRIGDFVQLVKEIL